MDTVLTFIREKIVGVPYFILVMVSIFLIFAIIGYLVSLKYKPDNNPEIDLNVKDA